MKGPNISPILPPILEEFLNPMILKIKNKIIHNKNSKKYFIPFILFFLIVLFHL